MSSRKVIDTKIQDDVNTDSGIVSGPLSDLLSEELDPREAESECGDKVSDERGSVVSKSDDRGSDVKGDGKSESEKLDFDSGVVFLSEQLDSLQVDEGSTRLPMLTVTDAGADVPPLAVLYQQDKDGDTPLHISAVHGCETSVGLLIRLCPRYYLLNVPNNYGHTPLHLAVLSGHPIVTRMLVRAGASLAMRDVNGDTPMHLATAAKNVECLQALLSPVGGKPGNGMPAALNMKNYAGQTCVHLAATSGHRHTMRILVHYGADINAKEGYAGWTPLHIAARHGDVRLAQLLLQCPGVAANARDYANRTPRRLATRMRTFSSGDAQKLLAQLPEESDDDDESDDEDDETEYPTKRVRVGQSDDWIRAGERDNKSAGERRKLAGRSDT